MTAQKEKATKDEVIKAKESEMSEKDRGFISLQQRCGSLQTQLETVQRRNRFLEVSDFSCYILASGGRKYHWKMSMGGRGGRREVGEGRSTM